MNIQEVDVTDIEEIARDYIPGTIRFIGCDVNIATRDQFRSSLELLQSNLEAANNIKINEGVDSRLTHVEWEEDKGLFHSTFMIAVQDDSDCLHTEIAIRHIIKIFNK